MRNNRADRNCSSDRRMLVAPAVMLPVAVIVPIVTLERPSLEESLMGWALGGANYVLIYLITRFSLGTAMPKFLGRFLFGGLARVGFLSIVIVWFLLNSPMAHSSFLLSFLLVYFILLLYHSFQINNF